MKRTFIFILFILLSCGEEPFCKRRSDFGKLLSDCKDDHRPIVFVHGLFGGYDNFSDMVERFIQNGYCPDKLIGFEYNTVNFLNLPLVIDNLEKRIRKVLNDTGYDKVDLIGHSLGGFVGYWFLNSKDNASLVEHYVHAASVGDVSFPEGVKVLNLSSRDDTAVGLTNIPGAINIEIPGADHMQVVSSEKSFVEVYKFFNDGEEPHRSEIEKENSPRIEGRVITLAENAPLSNLKIEIYPVSPDTGERLTEEPVACFITDEDGRWGIFTAERDVYYEFFITGESLFPSLHYYRQPFLGTRNSDRLRTLPQQGGFLEPIISPLLKFSDEYSVAVMFVANHGIYAGRDTASIDDVDLSTEYYADPSHTSLAFFFADFNQNGVSELTKGSLSSFPFFLDIDYFIPTNERKSIAFEVNGRKIAVPNWKPLTEGVSIAVFEY